MLHIPPPGNQLWKDENVKEIVDIIWNSDPIFIFFGIAAIGVVIAAIFSR